MEPQRSSGWCTPVADPVRPLTEDRDRIGHGLDGLHGLRDPHDLHDRVIRDLFKVGLKLHGALPLIEDGRAEQRVNEALSDLDQVITGVRIAVFELLRDPVPVPRTGLRARLVELVDEISRCVGHHPGLALDGPVDTVIDHSAEEPLVSALRESLIGLVRHAGAGASQMRLAAHHRPRPHLRIRVCGERLNREPPPHFGLWLESVRERIEAAHGELAVEIRPHAITMMWTVPGR